MSVNASRAVSVGELGRFLANLGSRFAAKTNASTTDAGLMSASDKAKLDGLSAYAEMSASDLAAGALASSEAMVASPKVVADYVSGEIDGALGVVANGSY